MGRRKKSGSKPPDRLTRDELRRDLKAWRTSEEAGELSDGFDELVYDLVFSGEDLAWLAAYDLDPGVSESANMVMFRILNGEDIPEDTRVRVRKEGAPVLLDAMRNERVPDARKYSLGPIHGLCQGEVSEEEYRSYFKDFEGTARRAATEAAEDIRDGAQGVQQVLQAMDALDEEHLPPGGRFHAVMLMAAGIQQSRPRAALGLVAANLPRGVEEGVPEATLDEALKALEKLQGPETLWYLDELGRWIHLGPLAEKSRHLASKMKMAGVAPHYELGAVFSHGTVSALDGAGSRQLSLFYRTAGGGMDAVLVLLSDHAGVKDVMGVFEEGAEIEEEIRDRLCDLPTAPCGLACARELFADGWARGGKLPASVMVYRPYLGEEALAPRLRTPDLGPYNLDAVERAPALFDGSEMLVETSSYGVFSFASDAAYAFLAANLPKRSPRLSKKMLEAFLHEVEAHEKEDLLARMAATLEVEAWGGRGARKVNQVAARTWLGLTENVMPFAEVPFIRALGEAAIPLIVENLRLGYRSQEEVNRDALDMDREFGDLLEDMD